MKKPMYTSSEAELRRIPLPEETATYKPVSHGELIDVTMDALSKAGFQLSSATYESAREGMIANARYVIKNVSDEEMALMVAWQNSYNKQISLKFAIGTHVFVCANGCVFGDFGSFKKKHTGEVQTFTPAAIYGYIGDAEEAFLNMAIQRDGMKEVILSDREIAEILGRLVVERGAMESSQLNIVRNQLVHPSFQYGPPNSVWQLYQTVTYALRKSHPADWLGNHAEAHELFIEVMSELNPSSVVVTTTDETSKDDSNQLTIFDIDQEDGC